MSSSRHHDELTPARPYTGVVRTNRRTNGGPSQESTSTTNPAYARQLPSPITTRSGRALGSVGTKTGPSYSPYARKTLGHEANARDSSFDRRDSEEGVQSSTSLNTSNTNQKKTGLFSGIKSIPGRALGYIFQRSNSISNLSSSASLQDVRRAVDSEARQQERSPEDSKQLNRTRSGAAQRSTRSTNATSALPRSKTSSNLNHQLASSSSLSALSTLANLSTPTAPASGSRSSHSTLVMPTSSNGPSFLASTSYSRQGSPAPSSNARSYSRRSPSPSRNQLAGSISAFNLASIDPYNHNPFQSHSNSGEVRMTSHSQASPPRSESNYGPSANLFGLQSRSPFAANPNRAPSIARSVSISSTSNLVGGSGGHSLFPYASPLPRGTSPSISNSTTTSRLNQKKSYVALGSPRARIVGSPLNPHYSNHSTTNASVFGGNESVNGTDLGYERARKKQMVWDADKGLVSREQVEREREAALPPPPKNEAERILEVLEGMGRTPLGESKRGAIRPINVPARSTASTSTLFSRSVSTPALPVAASPYGRKAPTTTSSTRDRGMGLEAQLRAREDRRRAQIEREREERERERREDEERERERAERRRRRRDEEERLRREEEDDLLMESIEDEVDVPRRKTRSMAKAAASTSTPAKTPNKMTRSRSSAAVVTSPKPTTRRSTRKTTASVADDEESQAEDTVMSPPPTTSSRRRNVKSPSPIRRTMKSPSPIREASPSPPPVMAPPTSISNATEASTYKPISEAERATSAASSSLRPGRSHTSRTHTSSSKVFSAREEDLPPVDQNDLGKIKLPEMKFPANFSFGPTASSATSKAAAQVPSSNLFTAPSPPTPATTKAAPQSSDSIFGRLGSASTPSTELNSSSTPAFSFAAAPPPPVSSKSEVSASSLPKSTIPSDFFSKPAVSTVPPSTSDASMTSTTKPNFFGNVSASEKKDSSAPPLPTVPSASDFFGVMNKKKEESPVASVPTTTSAAPVANPFAAFGKPVAEIVGKQISSSGEKDAKDAPASTSMFGPGTATDMFGSAAANASSSSGMFAASPKEKDEKKDTADKPAFSFAPSTTSAPSAASPFSFGAATSTVEKKPEDKSATSSPFSFGAPTAASVSATNTNTNTTATTSKSAFSFGAPAEKKDDAPKPSPFAGFGTASTPAAPVVMPAIEDPDEDSGMEDETGATTNSTPAPPASASPFSFSAPAASAAPSPFGAPATNGAAAAPSFSFGAKSADSTSSAPAAPASNPFGTTSGSSLFGAASSAVPTFGGFSPSPSPGPPSVGFSFGSASATSAAGPTPSPFAFGSTSSTAPAQNGGLFGSSSSASPFGTMNTSTASAMGQTLSAPGFGSASAASSAATSPFNAPPSASTGFNFGVRPGSSSSNPGTPTAGASPFNFGGPSTNTNPTSGFPAFGAAANANTGTVSPFGHPSPASNPAGGFTFGQPAASVGATNGIGLSTPVSPNAVAGGASLFSIGSGGEDTSPNKRKIAPLRRRRG